jgi:Flp pilus assembly protein TadB
MVAAFAGSLAGLGLFLVIRGAAGTTTPLTAVVAELHRPRRAVALMSWRDTVAARLVGRRTHELERDLAVCERSLADHVQQRLVWAALFAAPGALAVLMSAGGVISIVQPLVAVGTLVVGSVAGWVYSRVDLRSDAERARRDFRHALAAYLELVTILMAGGAGVETAMFDAAEVGRGRAFRHLRAALSAAQARRDAPWAALGELGDRLGVIELQEIEASMTLAGGGAHVRDSLVAKANGLRAKDLTAIESEAQARSETMVLPVALMFAGFLLLIGYPALAGLSATP